MANLITCCRILFSIILLFVPAFSKPFYVFYLLTGFSDMIDGTVARRLDRVTDFGAKLDTVADLIFAIAVIIKIIKAVQIPVWLMVWVGIILIVKIANMIIGFIRFRHFAAVHSIINKVCGAVVFLVPLVIGSACPQQVKTIVMICACVLPGAAAIDENAKILRKDPCRGNHADL